MAKNNEEKIEKTGLRLWFIGFFNGYVTASEVFDVV